MRKIILYPHSAMKPIILSDSSDSDISDLKKKITDCLSESTISILETSTDVLIIRPSEIQAVLITDKDFQLEEGPKKTDYDKKLVIPKPSDKK